MKKGGEEGTKSQTDIEYYINVEGKNRHAACVWLFSISVMFAAEIGSLSSLLFTSCLSPGCLSERTHSTHSYTLRADLADPLQRFNLAMNLPKVVGARQSLTNLTCGIYETAGQSAHPRRVSGAGCSTVPPMQLVESF